MATKKKAATKPHVPGSVDPEPAPVADVEVDGEFVRFAGRKFDADTAARSAEALAAAAQAASNNRALRING